jgi:regulatory protein
VRSAPRKFSTEEELYTAAMRALMRRAYSIHQMKAYLEQRAEDKGHVAAVIARLREQNYIDDARYAAEFTRQRTQSRGQGRFRIASELRARGVPDRHIDAALEAGASETDEAALIRKRIQRKLAHMPLPLDQKKLASLYRSLLRAGFPADIIRAELHRATHAEVPDVETSADES